MHLSQRPVLEDACVKDERITLLVCHCRQHSHHISVPVPRLQSRSHLLGACRTNHLLGATC
jgi:hypothetical protein